MYDTRRQGNGKEVSNSDSGDQGVIETTDWRIIATMITIRRVEAFEWWILRKMIRIYSVDKVYNSEVLRRTRN